MNYDYTDKRKELNTKLQTLNEISCKLYVARQNTDKSEYALYYKLGNEMKFFRYEKSIDQLIKTVEILIRYRMIEYESEY